MTYKVVLTVSQVDALQAIPSTTGVGPGKIRFAVTDSTGASVGTQDVDGLTATFTGLADGNFTASAQQLDLNGNALGSAVSTTFVDAQPVAATYQPLSALAAEVTTE